MNFSRKVIHYVIGTITSCEKMSESGKKKIETKNRWEIIDVIPLLKLVGINNCQPIM